MNGMTELEAIKWLQTLFGVSVYFGFYGVTLSCRGVDIHGDTLIKAVLSAKGSGWDRYRKYP